MKISHRLQTALLIMTLAALLSLLGYVLGGATGARLALVVAVLGFALTPAISPALVMAGAKPLAPEQAPGLYTILARLARRAGLETVPTLYFLPSGQPNAFAFGNGAEAAIGITRGLASALTSREMAGILSHEITHIKNNDTQIMALSAVFGRLISLLSLAGQMTLIVCLPLVLSGMMQVSLLLLLALAAAPWLSMLLFQALSRTREFEADLGSVTLLNDPSALVSALIKVENFQRSALRRFLPYIRRPDPMWLSHPPTEERIRRLMAHAPKRRTGMADGWIMGV